MSAAAEYYRRCRAAGTQISPAGALAWSRQASWGLIGYWSPDAALALGLGIVSPCGRYVIRPQS